MIYLHAEFVWQRRGRSISLAVPFLQALVATAAFYTCISRVIDNKHHPTDVIFGALLGLVVQTLNAVAVTRVYSRPRTRELLVQDDNKTGGDAEIPLQNIDDTALVTVSSPSSRPNDPISKYGSCD